VCLKNKQDKELFILFQEKMIMDKGAGIVALFEDERNFITNASNLCAFINLNFSDLNWVGFYFLSGEKLVLGPFQGKPACIRIAMGKGVCGTAAAKGETIVVDNVHEFEGHIACDAESNSEIVIPLKFEGRVFGVLDIDSPILNRFNEGDRAELESYAEELVNHSEIAPLIEYNSRD
jgi:GAF domain-containing protein